MDSSEPLVAEILTSIAAPVGYQQVPAELQAQHIHHLHQSAGWIYQYRTPRMTLPWWDKSSELI